METLPIAEQEIVAENASTRATQRVFDQLGIVDTATLLNSLAYDGQPLVTANEVPVLLKEAGLNDMSYDELLNNPEALKKVTKAKLEKVLEIANQNTDNKNVAVRMAAVGMVYGEDAMAKWDDAQYSGYSRQALKNYATGDYTPLSNIGSSNVLIADGRFDRSDDPNPVTRTLPTDLNGLNAMLVELESMEQPSAFLDKGKMGGAERAEQPPITGMIGDFFNLNRDIQPNPEYAPYQARVQQLKDMINITTNIGTERVWDPGNNRSFSRAAERILGKERWNNLLVEARNNPAWGSRGAGVQVISALLANQPEFEAIDFAFYDVDASEIKLGSNLAGQLPDNLLVNLDNNASVARQAVFGRDFKIRKDVAPDLIRLINDATKAGHKVQLNSGYRTYNEQVQAKKDAIKKGKPELAAEPGQSYHNLGTAIDINLPKGPEGEALHAWLMENIGNYNFRPFDNDWSIGVDDDEAWHFEWQKPN